MYFPALLEFSFAHTSRLKFDMKFDMKTKPLHDNTFLLFDKNFLFRRYRCKTVVLR